MISSDGDNASSSNEAYKPFSDISNEECGFDGSAQTSSKCSSGVIPRDRSKKSQNSLRQDSLVKILNGTNRCPTMSSVSDRTEVGENSSLTLQEHNLISNSKNRSDSIVKPCSDEKPSSEDSSEATHSIVSPKCASDTSEQSQCHPSATEVATILKPHQKTHSLPSGSFKSPCVLAPVPTLKRKELSVPASVASSEATSAKKYIPPSLMAARAKYLASKSASVEAKVSIPKLERCKCIPSKGDHSNSKQDVQRQSSEGHSKKQGKPKTGLKRSPAESPSGSGTNKKCKTSTKGRPSEETPTKAASSNKVPKSASRPKTGPKSLITSSSSDEDEEEAVLEYIRLTESTPADKAKPTYVTEIQRLMYAYGDCKRPLLESAKFVENMLHYELDKLMIKAYDIAKEKNKTEIDHECLLHMLRKHALKIKRLFRFLEVKDASKFFRSSNTDPEDSNARLPPTPKRVKKCLTYLSNACYCTKYPDQLDAMQDPLYDKRIKRHSERTETMTTEEYEEYTRARQTSFLKSTPKGCAKFRDWLLNGLQSYELSSFFFGKDCEAIYIGETGRNFKTRIKEHQYAIKTQKPGSKISEHAWSHQHSPNFDATSILTINPDYMKRTFLEGWFTDRCRHSINIACAIPREYSIL